jgi:hypothetical protein
MKHKLYFAFLLLYILLISCQNNQPVQLIKVNELVFDTEFKPTFFNSGYFYDKETNQEYMYFADVRTFKKLKIFSLDGTLKHEISLKEVIYGNFIDRLIMVHFDTIILTTNYNHLNRIFFLNKEGHCWKKIFLDTIINTPSNDIFEAYVSRCGNVFNNDILYLHYDRPFLKNKVSPTNKFEHGKYINHNRYSAPYFLVFNIKDNNNRLGANGLYYKFTDINHNGPEGANYCFTNNILFVFTSYTNKILVVNPITLKTERELFIKSAYTTLRNTFLKIESDPTYEYHNVILQTKANIKKIEYDKKNELYYVITLHEVDEDAKIRGPHRAFSIHIYNKEFKKLNEQCFEADTYDPNNFIITSKGILIENSKTDKSHEDAKKVKFSEFKISR